MPRKSALVPVELETEPTPRDFVMARLAAARASAMSSVEAIDEAISLFLEPEEDKRGKERTELISIALEAAGLVSRSLESAEASIAAVDFEEGEPWEDAEMDDEGDEDGE